MAVRRSPHFPPEAHRQVLKECPDVPCQRPPFPVVLDEVGIGAKTVWLNLPAGRLAFALELAVELCAGLRGIHMSRLEQAISELNGRDFANPAAYALALGRMILLNQEARRGWVEISGQQPWSRATEVSGLASLDAYDLRVRVVGEALELAKEPLWTTESAVGVYHITACPCTQVYNRLLFPAGAAAGPLPTHSQRSHTSLTLTLPPGTEPPPPELLLDCLASALHLSQDLLKRPDEAELVHAAHSRPQFAEDAVRETARAAACLLGPRLPATCRVGIATVGFESIHIHDVRCRLNSTLGELVAIARSGSGEGCRD